MRTWNAGVIWKVYDEQIVQLIVCGLVYPPGFTQKPTATHQSVIAINNIKNLI